MKEQHNFINDNNQAVHHIIEFVEKGPDLASFSKQVSVHEKDTVQLKEHAHVFKGFERDLI